MKVIWDKDKEKKLLRERKISLSEIGDMLMSNQFIEVLENPQHPNQLIFILSYKDYTHAVPFIIDSEGAIVLKTAYPSRKHHKLFGGISNESKTR